MHFICSACITENQDIEPNNAEKTKSSSIFMLLKASAEHKKLFLGKSCVYFLLQVFIYHKLSLYELFMIHFSTSLLKLEHGQAWAHRSRPNYGLVIDKPKAL